jgi:hypothetical protein
LEDLRAEYFWKGTFGAANQKRGFDKHDKKLFYSQIASLQHYKPQQHDVVSQEKKG